MNRLVSAFVYVSKGGGKVLNDYIEKHEGAFMVYVGHCAKTLMMPMICTRRPG